MNEVKVVSIFKEKDSYYAALPYEEEISSKAKTYQKTAVDVNVGHFNYTEGQSMFCLLNCKSFISVLSIIKECWHVKEKLTVS